MLAIKKIFRIHKSLRYVFIRFPLPVILAIAAVIVSWMLIHKFIKIDKGFIAPFYLSIAINFVAQIVLKLYAESESWPLKKYLVGSLGLLIAIVLYVVYLIDSQHVAPFIFLIIALLLSVLFAPYLKQQGSMNSFWYFNYQTGSALFFSAIAGLILGGGLSLILVSITYLFEIKVDELLYADIWILTGFGFVPLYILTNISRQFIYNDESCEFPKGISFISNYLLVPLMMAYMLVLYAYFIKIILQWELPKGYLGWMIISFGSIGVLTKLVAYPICDKGNKLLSIFDKYFYKALIIPVLVLFFAVSVRINNYGITEVRYAVIMLAMWFSAIIVISIFYKEKFHIKHIPMILAGLAVISAYGPLSAANISLSSQQERFEYLLKENNLLVDGKLNKKYDMISYEKRRSLYSTATYLSNSEWRSKRTSQKLKKWAGKKSEDEKELTARQLLSQLNVEYAGDYYANKDRNVERFNIYSGSRLKKQFISIKGYDFISQNRVSVKKNKPNKSQWLLRDGERQEEISIKIMDGIFTILRPSGEQLAFDLKEMVLALHEQGIDRVSEKDKEKVVMIKESKTSNFKARIVFETLSGNIIDNKQVTFYNLKYVLMIKLWKD